MEIAITVPVVATLESTVTFVVTDEQVKNIFHDKDVQQLINGNKLIAYVCAEEFLQLEDNVELADFETCIDSIKVEPLRDSDNTYDLQQAMMP